MKIINRGTLIRASTAGALCLVATQTALSAPFLVVGVDEKMRWDEAGKPIYDKPGQDSVVIVDIARPGEPRIVAALPLENSVAGPPTNLAVSPDNRTAIIANSVTNVPGVNGYKQVPAKQLFVVDLASRRPKLVQTLETGKQPSGLSINVAGTLALVANRADTTVSVFTITRGRLQEIARVDVGDSPSHVAFTPDGRRALVVKQDVNKVAVLDINGNKVTHRSDLSTRDGPYNVEVTPDGTLGIVNDRGILTLIDMTDVEHVVGHVKVGNGSEGMAISPRGDLVVSVALRGSNGSQQSDKYHERGAIVVLARTGQSLTPVSTIEVGRVPEGVAFSPDGKYLYVANFYDDDIWVFLVEGTSVTDTGKRLKLPGHPASARTVTSRLSPR